MDGSMKGYCAISRKKSIFFSVMEQFPLVRRIRQTDQVLGGWFYKSGVS